MLELYLLPSGTGLIKDVAVTPREKEERSFRWSLTGMICGSEELCVGQATYQYVCIEGSLS